MRTLSSPIAHRRGLIHPGQRAVRVTTGQLHGDSVKQCQHLQTQTSEEGLHRSAIHSTGRRHVHPPEDCV